MYIRIFAAPSCVRRGPDMCFMAVAQKYPKPHDSNGESHGSDPSNESTRIYSINPELTWVWTFFVATN